MFGFIKSNGRIFQAARILICYEKKYHKYSYDYWKCKISFGKHFGMKIFIPKRSIYLEDSDSSEESKAV